MSIGLLVIDHGSRKATSNLQLKTIAVELRALAPDCVIGYAHMEIAEPSIAVAIRDLVTAGVQHIHVLPYFLGAGRHISQDIPQLVADAVNEHDQLSYDIGSALGPDISLARLLLQRSPFSHSIE